MIYHIYKTDCYRASRVLMQQRWEKESIFIHLAKNKDYQKNIELGLFNLLKKIKSSSKVDVFIFHAQSSLPYLMAGWIAKKILKKKSNIVYDIHDLHEWDVNDAKFSKNTIRFYILGALERAAFKIKEIKKLTVSQGISEVIAREYGVNPPIVVRNISIIQNENKKPIETRINNAVVFFGTRERVPFKIINELKKFNIELHLYGKNITKEWLKKLLPENDLENVKFFGEYDPNNLEFLDAYKAMIIFAPENKTLNFKYSLPNKLFQALERGVAVVISENFEEMRDTFPSTPMVTSSCEKRFVENTKKVLENISQKDLEDASRRVRDLCIENRLVYLNAISEDVEK